MIKSLIVAIAALWLSVSPGLAYELPSTERTAIQNVIQQQLQAFQADDGVRAFSFASPTIKGMFRTADRFMSMVKTGYRAVYRPQDVTFQELTQMRGQPNQRVLLVGPDGVPVIANYLMERQPDGTWLIDGCILEETEDLTT